jgi:hypothetical protein
MIWVNFFKAVGSFNSVYGFFVLIAASHRRGYRGIKVARGPYLKVSNGLNDLKHYP